MKAPDSFRTFCASFQRDNFQHGSTFEDIAKASFAALAVEDRIKIRAYFDFLLSDTCSNADVVGAWRRGRPDERIGPAKKAKEILRRMRNVMQAQGEEP